MVEQAAGIVTQIQNQRRELAAGFFAQRSDRLAQARFGLFGKLRQPDVANIIGFQARFDDLDVNGLADQRHFQRFVNAGALDGQGDLRVRRAAHLVDRVVQR